MKNLLLVELKTCECRCLTGPDGRPSMAVSKPSRAFVENNLVSRSRPRARLLVCGVQALIRKGGEQGPPRWSMNRLIARSWARGLFVRTWRAGGPS